MYARTVIRDEYNGFTKMVAFVDYVMFGNDQSPAPQQGASSTATSATPAAQLTCRVNSYTVIIKSETAALLAEMMKTIFNVTLNWYEKDDDVNEVEIVAYSVHNSCCFILCRRTCTLSNVLLIY